MLKYLTVFDPSRSHTEEDSQLSLLLYHEFGQDIGCSVNDKLSKVGMIQGIWSLTQSMGGFDDEDEKIIELDNEIILVICVETNYFICISLEIDSNDDTKIPYQFYLSHLWFGYKFFVLEYGNLKSFDMNTELTDKLNEQLVPFWHDIFLKPETLIRRGIETLWPNSFKKAEFNINQDSEHGDEMWDSIIRREIMLQEESYLGVEDILVYHLPCESNISNNEKIEFKTHGLIRNFSPDLINLADISNWILHLNSVYDRISSHVLAGNAHFKEKPSEVDEETFNDDYNLNGNNEISGQSLAERITHNLALPVSFAYDAVHEMGVTTGVSSSISFFKDHIPSVWPFSQVSNSIGDKPSLDNSRCGFLISPLSSNSLPDNYKVKRMNLNFSHKKVQDYYNTLFWYFDDILVVIVCNPTFDKIWDKNYLTDLGFILTKSMDKFYKTAFDIPNDNKRESFAYCVVQKGPNLYEVKSSIPSCSGLLKEAENRSPFELVISGVDNLITMESDARKWGIDMMGEFFFGSKVTTSPDIGEAKSIKLNNFLSTMTVEKLWELQKEIVYFLESLDNSRVKNDVVEERLLTLNNGLMCYIRVENEKLIIIMKNWFDIGNNNSKNKRRTLFEMLGKDVVHWWENFQQQ